MVGTIDISMPVLLSNPPKLAPTSSLIGGLLVIPKPKQQHDPAVRHPAYPFAKRLRSLRRAWSTSFGGYNHDSPVVLVKGLREGPTDESPKGGRPTTSAGWDRIWVSAAPARPGRGEVASRHRWSVSFCLVWFGVGQRSMVANRVRCSLAHSGHAPKTSRVFDPVVACGPCTCPPNATQVTIIAAPGRPKIRTLQAPGENAQFHAKSAVEFGRKCGAPPRGARDNTRYVCDIPRTRETPARCSPFAFVVE